jgi:ubiquitin-like-conjugating enzyme ATG10
MASSGTIQWDEFEAECVGIAAHAAAIGECWQWHSPKPIGGVNTNDGGGGTRKLDLNAGRGYLSLTNAMVTIRTPLVGAGPAMAPSATSSTREEERSNTTTIQLVSEASDDEDEEGTIPDGTAWGVDEDEVADAARSGCDDGRIIGSHNAFPASTPKNNATVGSAGTTTTTTTTTTAGDEGGRVLVFEYHIVYSTSYSVPVLYFNVAELDGTPLRGVEIWAIMPSSVQSGYDRMMTVTEADHPVLGTPFFQLHPCNTVSLMTSVGRSSSSSSSNISSIDSGGRGGYVRSWTSLTGHVIGLTLALSYHTAVTAHA